MRQLPTYGRLAWGLLRDERVPGRQKLILAAVGAYLLTPFDVIPDFVPVLGQLDDVAVVLLGLRWFIRSAPEEVVAEHLARIARDEDDMGRDLERAQRLLGESFVRIREEFDRIVDRRGDGDRRGGHRDGQDGQGETRS